MIRSFIRRRPVTFAVGSTYAGYLAYTTWDDWKRFQGTEVSQTRLLAAKFLPWKWSGRLVGYLADCHVPINLRRLVYGSYAKATGCNLEEMAVSDLRQFRTFNDFFARHLRPGVRTFDRDAIVSPCDGKVVYAGAVSSLDDATLIPNVKGTDHYLHDLVGEAAYKRLTANIDWSKERLFFCTIYLSPKDYHRFHSPCDKWKMESATPMAGDLMTVAPWALHWLPQIPVLNERLVLEGTFSRGLFSQSRMIMVPVGATNVGSIRLTDQLKTDYKKGQEVGYFQMGSMVVLVFTASKQRELKVQAGQDVHLGQGLLASA